MHLINYCVPKFHEMLTAVKFNFFQLSINTFHFDLEYGVFYYTHFFLIACEFHTVNRNFPIQIYKVP